MEDLTDNEREEQLRRWWSDNWAWILGGIALGIAILWGFNYWKSAKLAEAQQDEFTYESVIELLSQSKFDDAVAAAKALRDRHPKSPYTDQADLAVARAAVEARKYEDGADHLRVVMEASRDAELRSIARTRLARVYVEQGKFDDDRAARDRRCRRVGGALPRRARRRVRGQGRPGRGTQGIRRRARGARDGLRPRSCVRRIEARCAAGGGDAGARSSRAGHSAGRPGTGGDPGSMNRLRRLAALATLGLIAGCNTDTTVEPPAELVDIRTTLPVHRLWSEGLGGDGAVLRLTLGVAGMGDTVYAAGRGGDVRAMDAATGKVRWSTDTDLELSAGPGVGEGLVVVGTSDGDVVALDAATGKQRWKGKIPGELLAPPLVQGGHVIVRSVEGRLRALDATDGKEQWLVEDVVPRLSLRGTATPVAAEGGTVVCGFDTGKLMAVTLDKGETLWQLQLATPHGRTELERLSDVDSAVRISGKDVYAVGYQGRVAMLSLDGGQIWWSRDLSSYRGLDIDDDQVYVATSDGSVVALRRRDGAVVWEQKALARRGLSTPAVVGSVVVVGDFEGYLHFLDRSTGKFVAREHPGSERIAAPPLVIGDRVYAIDEGGHLEAYRVGSAAGG